MQKKLNAEQVAAFYHDRFVQQQVEHFKRIALPSFETGKVVIDIGGGCGYFASAIKKELDIPTRVIGRWCTINKFLYNKCLASGISA